MEEQPKLRPNLLPGAIAYFLVGLLMVYGWSDNGWGMFTFIPIVAGFACGLLTLLTNRDREVGLSHTFLASMIGVCLVAIGLIVMAREGAMCLLMAAPIVLMWNVAGLGLAHAVDSLYRKSKKLYAAPLFVLPFGTVAMDYVLPGRYDDLVHTELLIDAKTEEVWPYLFKLDLPPPDEWLFRMGIAHPTAVRSSGEARTCVLSTGGMPEVIEVRETNRRMRFRVLDTPPTMKEMSPYDIHPDHLDGYFECVWGEFELIPTRDGKTRLIGRSAYRCRFGPADYWKLWTRKIVSDTQRRVMREVKRQAEKGS